MKQRASTDGKPKITIGTKVFYGIGQAGDTIPYTMFYTFYLIFLTDVVGIKPIVAGSVSAISILWNAILDPAVGYLSDNCRSRYGRRRIFMGSIILPYTAITFLLFFPIEGSQLFLSIYYIALGVALWSCYTVWVIPYLSLVSDMTTDYNERNDLRMYNTIFASVFMAAAMSGPLAVQEICLSIGYSEKFSWAFSGAVFAVVTGVAIFVCWRGMKGREPENLPEDPQEERENILQIAMKCLRLRAARLVCVLTVIGILGITTIETMEMYLFTNRLGMSEGEISGFFAIYAVAGVLAVPIISKLANRAGKREIFLFNAVIATVGAAFFWQKGINTYTDALIYIMVIFSLFAGVFWLMYISFAYDIAEIYAYRYGRRRDASIVAIVDLAYKIGAAAAAFVSGALLSVIGYEEGAAHQMPEVLDGINTISTLPGAVAFGVSAVILFLYPVTKKRYNAMVAASEARKEGREYSEDGFRELLR